VLASSTMSGPPAKEATAADFPIYEVLCLCPFKVTSLTSCRGKANKSNCCVSTLFGRLLAGK